ncbi:Far upstream element-binding protein like [Melia azedarach]|uniref:Far upstream element-binding protein like n=1 Tax=Melia azedarach TaxID=155640 RepID=A0ACC1XRW8_MELAZ|nr:Far upstream element-binding protein like [Melia azedarach]
MAEEEVLAPAVSAAAASADLKRKLDDLESEAVESAEDQLITSPNGEADVVKNGDDVAEADDGSEAKRPRIDDGNEKPDGLANANGLKGEELDGVVDAGQPTEDSTKEEEQETEEVKTEQHSSVDEHISAGNQQVSVKEETKEVLINTEEASVAVEEETKEVTIQEETVEPSNEEQQQQFDNSVRDEPSSTDGSSMSRKIEVPNNKVGVLIGKAGDTIRYLQYNSGAKIQITRDADADPHSATRPVEIIGTLSNIEKAEKLINAVIAEADAGGSPSLVARGLATAQAAGAGEQVEIKVPNEKVGLIIGRGGETIKGLQTRSGARIQLIPQHLPEGDGSKERIVRVTGDMRQIEMAQEMIKEVLSQTVRPSPLSGGFNQQPYRPRGPPGPPQWGPRGSHPAQPMAYDYQQRGPYPSQNPQYPHPTYGNYPPQHMAPRSNFGGPPSMQGPPQSGTGGYDYYGGQGGHVSDRPVSISHSTPLPGHPPVPSQAPGGGPPPSQANYNYGQPHGPEYGHQPPYAQTAPQQGYGHGYDDNHAPVQHPYGGHGNSQPAYSQGGLQAGYSQQQQYGKPPYGVPTQGAQAQSYGPPRSGQPGEMPYQSQVPAAQSYGPSVPHQQQYPYATSGAMQQTYPSYGSAPATEGYNQPPPVSGPGYSQGQAVPGYTQPAGQQAPGYGQVAPTTAYAQYASSQQVYPEQQAPSNAGYGYQGTQDPSYGSTAAGSAYTAPPAGQPGYAQPTPTQPSYDQAASQSTAYGVAQGNAAAVGYGKTVSPQPGYPQYDTTQMYAAPR